VEKCNTETAVCDKFKFMKRHMSHVYPTDTTQKKLTGWFSFT